MLMGFAKHNKALHIKNKTPKYTQEEINSYDRNKFTALWFAVTWKATETAKILVEFGADPNLLCGSMEESCLH